MDLLYVIVYNSLNLIFDETDFLFFFLVWFKTHM